MTVVYDFYFIIWKLISNLIIRSEGTQKSEMTMKSLFQSALIEHEYHVYAEIVKLYQIYC